MSTLILDVRCSKVAIQAFKARDGIALGKRDREKSKLPTKGGILKQSSSAKKKIALPQKNDELKSLANGYEIDTLKTNESLMDAL